MKARTNVGNNIPKKDFTEQDLQTFRDIAGVRRDEYEAIRARKYREGFESKILGKHLEMNDPDPFPGFDATLSKEDMVKIVNDHIKIGLTVFGEPNIMAWERYIKIEDFEGLLWTDFAKDEVTIDQKTYIIIVPSILVVNPPAGSRFIENSLNDVNIDSAKSNYNDVIKELMNGQWEFYGQIEKGRPNHTAMITNIILNIPANQEFANKLRTLTKEQRHEMGKKYLLDGGYHEIGHVMAMRMTDNQFKEWGKLIDEEINELEQNAKNIKQIKTPAGLYLLRNQIKAWESAAIAQKKGQLPLGMTAVEFARWKAYLENFADKWMLYINMQNGNKTMSEQLGNRLTPKQIPFFDRYLANCKKIQKNLLSFDESDNLPGSTIYQITGHTST